MRVIDHTNSIPDSEVVVEDSLAGLGTTLILDPGARVGTASLGDGEVLGRSRVEIRGGAIGNLDAFDTATVLLASGAVDDLRPNGHSRVRSSVVEEARGAGP